MSRIARATLCAAAATQQGVVIRRSSATVCSHRLHHRHCRTATCPASAMIGVVALCLQGAALSSSGPGTPVPRRVALRAVEHVDQSPAAPVSSLPPSAASTKTQHSPTSPPPAQSSPSSATLRQQRLSIPTATLAPPESMTHEHLAYAHCPICRLYLHACDMYLHLTSKHKELNPKHCQRMCADRLAMYRRVIGVDLVKEQTLGSALSTEAADAAAWDRFLPTLLDGGGYICNWCERRDVVHATRDQFLKHVAKEHGHLDLDLVEGKVPSAALSTRREASHSASSIAPAPRRRLTAVVEATAEAAVTVPAAPPRPTVSTVAATRLVATAATAAAPDAFPCELCGKKYGSETFLLQHFEMAHPYGDLEPLAAAPPGGCNTTSTSPVPSSPSTSAVQEIARLQQMEMMASNKRGIANFMAECDLCGGKSMLFKTPSALYAHLRTKHPLLDASAELKRLSDKSVVSFKCPECSRIFGSKDAMEAHCKEKHGASKLAGGGDGMVQLVANPYWCHDCEKGFSSSRALHGHLSTKHGLPSAMHPCPACKRVFSDPFSLAEHISQAHKTLPSNSSGADEFECDACGRCFLSKLERGRHIAKHHPASAAASAALSGETSSRTLPATSSNAAPKKTAILRRRAASVAPEDEGIRVEDVEIVKRQ